MNMTSRCLLDSLLTETLKNDNLAATQHPFENKIRQQNLVERHGFEVGYRFAERLVASCALMVADHLEAVKFLCKDFWQAVFGKQIDKLQFLPCWFVIGFPMM